MSGTPKPRQIRLTDAGTMLRLDYGEAEPASLSAEFLRVHSPSAEVQGHGAGEGRLIGGKRRVSITGIDPVGRYAIRLRFSDGHDSGLFSWQLLHDYARDQQALWQRYLARLAEAGMSREDADNVVPLNALLKR